MKRNIYAALLTFVVLFASSAAVMTGAQTNRRRAGAQRTPATAAATTQDVVPLPASDAVVFVDLKRLLSDAIPRALASDPAKLAEVNADLEQFKTRTGIDPRAFDRLAVGARLVTLPDGKLKIDNAVAVAHGTFDAAALVAAGRIAANGQYTEQKHGGKSVYVFRPQDRIKLFGLLSVRASELALTVLDATTLAIGEPAAVRAAIDAQAGRGRVSAEMVTLARQNPNAIVGFGGLVPASATKGLDLGNEEISRSVASIRQFYGSLGTTASGFDLLTVLRTTGARDAQSLSDTLTALKQFAPLLLARLPGERGRIAQKAVDSLRVTAQGTEVQLRLEVAQTDIAALVNAF
jgi:hypothetical protein